MHVSVCLSVSVQLYMSVCVHDCEYSTVYECTTARICVGEYSQSAVLICIICTLSRIYRRLAFICNWIRMLGYMCVSLQQRSQSKFPCLLIRKIKKSEI